MRTAYAILGIALLFAGCAPSQAPEESGETAVIEEAASEGETSAETEAVSQLNATCPENWCMGDYQYEFQRIACVGANCTLTFTAERDGESHGGVLTLDYDEPLIDEFDDLEVSYFERVTDALDEWESAQAGAGG